MTEFSVPSIHDVSHITANVAPNKDSDATFLWFHLHGSHGTRGQRMLLVLPAAHLDYAQALVNAINEVPSPEERHEPSPAVRAFMAAAFDRAMRDAPPAAGGRAIPLKDDRE